MTMQYDVKSAQLAATESVNQRARLKGVLISSAANGVIEISDGSTGNDLFQFNAVSAGSVYVAIPGEGILFQTSIYAKRVDNSTITVFYG